MIMFARIVQFFQLFGFPERESQQTLIKPFLSKCETNFNVHFGAFLFENFKFALENTSIVILLLNKVDLKSCCECS